MSNHTLEKQLDLVISLLETLPERMCDEIEVRQEVKKALEVERIKLDIEFYQSNLATINRAMFGGLPPVEEKIDKEI